MSLFGTGLIIWASFFRDNEVSYEGSDKIHVYALLMLLGAFLNSCQKAYEEYLMRHYEISLRRFLGLQGFLGFTLSLFFQIIFSAVFYIHYSSSNSTSEIKNFFHDMQIGETIIYICQSIS